MTYRILMVLTSMLLLTVGFGLATTPIGLASFHLNVSAASGVGLAEPLAPQQAGIDPERGRRPSRTPAGQRVSPHASAPCESVSSRK